MRTRERGASLPGPSALTQGFPLPRHPPSLSSRPLCLLVCRRTHPQDPTQSIPPRGLPSPAQATLTTPPLPQFPDASACPRGRWTACPGMLGSRLLPVPSLPTAGAPSQTASPLPAVLILGLPASCQGERPWGSRGSRPALDTWGRRILAVQLPWPGTFSSIAGLCPAEESSSPSQL